MSLPKRKEVMVLSLNDYRFVDIPVEQETTYGLICKKHEKIIHRYWYGGPAWTGKIIRFLGCRGIPLTSWIVEAEKRVEGTVVEFLKFIWGEKAYEGLPQELRNTLENKVGVIVTVKPDIPEELTPGVNKLKIKSALADVTAENLQNLGKSEEKKTLTTSLMAQLPGFCIGLIVMLLMVGWKIIKVAP